jgi:NAD(P)-dependent dehydrogenase (short-subunit alcohol dehydrogenase family)
MLERIAGDLVRAAESLAREELSMPNRDYGAYGYMPVLVTNAKLFACRVDTSQVELTDGSLPASAHFEEVKAIRFRKALATDLTHAPETYETIRKGLLAKERSAFVVNVNALAEWLGSVKETSRPITFPAPWSHLLR